MAPSCLGLLAARHQALQRILTNRFQHAEARCRTRRFDALHETLMYEGGEAVQNVDTRSATDRFRRLERAATHEDRQAAKQCSLFLGQQVVRPGDGFAHRLQARWLLAWPTSQQS